MDVASLVKNITSAFEDASTLVSKIRRQKAGDPNAHLEPIDDLLDSLILGPTVVRGYYESDAKRFGSVYMAGDPVAKEQLKDALINLQMTVLSGLRAVMLDETDPDYDAIQAASDDCRVNVGVCLGQLSQRVSKAAKGMSSPGRAHIYDQIPAKPVQRSNSHSTNSSSRTKTTPMTPPESDTEYLDAGTLNSQRGHKFVARAPDFDVMDGMHAPSYVGLYPTSQDTLPYPQQRHTTLPLIRPLESPVSPPGSALPSQNRVRDSSFQSTAVTSSPRNTMQNTYQTYSNQDSSGTGEPSADVGYFGPHANDHPRANSWSGLTSATLGQSRVSPNLVPVNRKPVTTAHCGSMVQSPTTMSTYHRLSIPEEAEEKIYIPPTLPVRSQSRSGSASHSKSISFAGNSETIQRSESVSHGSTMMSHRLSQGSSLQRSDTVSRSSITGPLSLPTEKNLRGFCKGAFRLQIGNEKDAFVTASKPLGSYGMMSYWQCKSSKCNYEGTCATITRPGSKKTEKIYDPTVRDYSGIRYKWVFLAKCHVPLKSMPEGKMDGSYGGFCCIFCTAEAALREWPAASVNNSINSAEKSSQKSGNSGEASDTPNMPIYGNIHSFMDHLQMHRREEYWPGIEMQGRMKCVVGRVAQIGEEFEINLVPIPPEMNWHEMGTIRDD